MPRRPKQNDELPALEREATLDREAAPDRRRPRLDRERVLRVRIDLDDAKPPIWRRLDLRSHLMLDELHHVVQAAFGWTDSHLHRFAIGAGSPFDSAATAFLCPYEVEEGDIGFDARDVRLDEVLQDVGDRLLYAYDFGDGWEHVITIESVRSVTDDDPPARFVTGRRAAPPEDSGGIGWYQQQLAEGELVEAQFDDTAVAEAVGAATDPLIAGRGLPPGVARIALRTAGSPVAAEIETLVRAAGLADGVELAADDMARLFVRFRWLLENLGDGVKLTAAGWLPPAFVLRTCTELGLDGEWMGKGNRENQTMPVLELRHTATKLGLVRKSKGVVAPTAAGRRAAADPLVMWNHVLERFPLGEPGGFECDVLILVLIWLACDAREGGGDDGVRSREQLARFVGAGVEALGWEDRSRGRISGWQAMHGSAGAEVLEQLGLRVGYDREIGLPRAAAGVAAEAAAVRRGLAVFARTLLLSAD